MTCNTARCKFCKAGCVCVLCLCLERCVNRTPQTHLDEMRIKKVTKGTETGKRKQQRGRAKGVQPTQETLRT